MTELRTQFVVKEESLEDLQSTCFICAKQLSSQNTQKENSCNTQYSIRPIFRHLKINQVKCNEKQSVDKVPLCHICHKICIKLSKCCAELEVLSLKIDYFFNQLNQLIFAENTKQNQATIFDKARRQLKRKLEEKSSINQKTGPFVIIPQLDVNQVVEDHTSDIDYESDTNVQPKQKQKMDKLSHNKSNKKFNCSECGRKFKTSTHILQHSTLCHPENHFPSKSKPENWTQLQYNMYLIKLLNTEADKCGSSITGYKCIYCKIAFKERQKRSVRIHLIQKHQDILLENLAQMPMDFPEKESKLKQFDKFKNKMKTEYTCSICQVCTTSLRKHEAIHHPEKFLLSKRLEHVSLEHFKMYCVHLIKKEAEKFTKSLHDRKLRFHCIYCQNSYTDLHGCRNHLLLGHSDLLLVEIEKLQYNTKPEELEIVRTVKKATGTYTMPNKKTVDISAMKCEICDVRLTQRGMALHLRKRHQNEYVKRYKCEMCSICKKTFRSKWWVDYHRTSAHTDKLLEKWKASAVSGEEFKSYCECMMDKEIKSFGQVRSKDGDVRYKCSYCKSTFVDMKYAHIHLVVEHKEILGNKIKELQKNTTVAEIKQGVGNKREEFEDELGKDDGFEATEVFCAKNVTKQEGSECWDETNDEMEHIEVLNGKSPNPDGIPIKQECMMDVEAILPN